MKSSSLSILSLSSSSTSARALLSTSGSDKYCNQCIFRVFSPLNIIACFRVLLRVRSSVDLNAHLKLKDTRAALDVREESEFGIKPSPSVIARERCAC